VIDIATICKDLYCLCRFCRFKTEGARRGRELEQIFYDYCVSQRIQPTEFHGFTLFGYDSWSGAKHEVDSGIGWDQTGIHFEFKAYQYDIVKDQVMIFNEKSIDYFFSIHSHNRHFNFYRILVSDSPFDVNATRLCYLWSIIHIGPDILPIPVILHYFRDPVWEDRVEPVLLSEGERILSEFVRPLNFKLRLAQGTTYALSIPEPHEIDEAEDAHRAMSQELLDTIECYEPDHFENYAATLMSRIGTLP